MPQKTTKNSRSKRGVSAAELKPIEAIVSGKTMTAAAEAAGVDRTTLYRWQRTNAPFREAMAQAREELEATFALRRAAIADTAFEGLQGGVLVDPKTALAFLEKSGLLQPRRSSEVVDGSDTTAD